MKLELRKGIRTNGTVRKYGHQKDIKSAVSPLRRNVKRMNYKNSSYTDRKKKPCRYCTKCDGRHCRGYSPPRKKDITKKSKPKWEGCRKKKAKQMHEISTYVKERGWRY